MIKCLVCGNFGEFTQISIGHINDGSNHNFKISNPKRNTPSNSDYEYTENKRPITVELYACPKCGVVILGK